MRSENIIITNENTESNNLIIDDNNFAILCGVTHTTSEFKNFLEIDDYTVTNPVSVNCTNGRCSV